ncbi:hypothetical protein INS49_004679 [Diaporthe citri]|uniref:uncharacterized protein n=1 Tax=Diaporthe citri TaxID=83186 RepID=UPI001C82213D|nr:uncharacterized protein INS49_004679 [Diaporthe citri]KAG6354661.1 hypothetical protein INS49_004679 [Diaporthe citri]
MGIKRRGNAQCKKAVLEIAERHEKCDEQQPACGRCEKRGVECQYPERKWKSFRRGSPTTHEANFPSDQSWVNSRPRAFRHVGQNSTSTTPISNVWVHSPPGETSRTTGVNTTAGFANEADYEHSVRGLQAQNDARLLGTSPAGDERFFIAGKDLLNASTPGSSSQVANYNSPYDGSSTQMSQYGPSPDYHTPSHSTVPSASSPGVFRSPAASAPNQPEYTQESPRDSYGTVQEQSAKRSKHFSKSNYPLDDVQEACLLRHFVEVIAHWFDHCDSQRHFHTIVPRRARHCEPLLNAIFAVAARHLVRVPRYRTGPGGTIEYLGQPLPNLTAHTAFEYMLRCIPALHDVPQIQDEEYRENLAAAAVILRQFEEMDQDQDSGEKDTARPSAPGDTVSSAHLETRESSHSSDHGVNFLDIAKAILRTTTTSGSNGLTDAAGWLALRQEIYYAFSLGRSPQISLPREQEREASPVNKLILHTYQVAKWNYGDKTVQEWDRLKAQEETLETDCCSQFTPVIKREADKSRGEVFPLVWYASDAEVTATQHFILAKTVLTAENPSLNPDRGVSREAEHQVRSHILQLCGLAMHHLGSTPNLVTAAAGITLYGDYFQDPWERAALLRVLDEWKGKHAWPVRKAYQMMGVQVAP